MNALEPMVHEVTSAAAMLTRAFSRNAIKEKKRKRKEGEGEEGDADNENDKAANAAGGDDDDSVAPQEDSRDQLEPREVALTLEMMRENQRKPFLRL